MKFLYWNLHKNSAIHDCLVALIREQQPDIAIFSEWDLKKAELLIDINLFSSPKYGILDGLFQEPFIITKYTEDIIERVKEDRTFGSICRINPLISPSFLLFALHLPSKLYRSDLDPTFNAQRLSRMIENEEEREGHRRSILIGDLNMNPFEPGVIAGDCFHAVMDKSIAEKKSRTVGGVERYFFYNPMWSRFGDDTPGPPGTYYYNSGRQVNHYWNMFDQVLVRPGLLDYFDTGSLKIIDSAGSYNLLKPSGIPDSERISDHLPIAFEMNMNCWKGDKNEY